MSFLKKHYEKIILTILLLLFVVALIYQISIVLTARQIKPEDLELPKKKPDYRQIDFTRSEYNVMENLSKNDLWLKSGPRKEGDKFWTDLMIPFECARSIYGRKKIVPLYYFMNKYSINRCPWTGKKLEEPSAPPTPEDMDKDGLPNKLESLAELDKESPEDANYDKDGDGFSNIVEYNFFKLKSVEAQAEAIKNPKIHPSLALRLYVKKIIRTKINIKLKKVRERGDDKKSWEIHIEVRTKKGWRSRFPSLGETITVDGDKYKIIGVDSVIKKVFDKTLNMVVKKNESEIVIQPEGSKEKILVTVGKSTYAPKKKVLIKDAIDDSSYTVIVGQNFTVGNTELGKETFTLLNADANSGIAIIKSVGKDGKEYKISREQMEKPGAEGKKKKPDMMDPGMMMPGEEFPGGLPRDLKRKKEYLRGKNRNRPTGFPEL